VAAQADTAGLGGAAVRFRRASGHRQGQEEEKGAGHGLPLPALLGLLGLAEGLHFSTPHEFMDKLSGLVGGNIIH